MIKDFRKKRLSAYLAPNMSVIIELGFHGIGDVVMFQPLLKRLRELYPDTTISFKAGKGQEYFNSILSDTYDETFWLTFPEYDSELISGTLFPDITKPEACCIYELGIPYDESMEFTWKPEKPVNCSIKVPDNTIGLSFQVTSGPKKNIPETIARFLWNYLKSKGYAPLEVQFEHEKRNPVNVKYSFVNNTCRSYPATVENMIGVIQQCKGFIGVNTGTFCTAASLYRDRVFHIHKHYTFLRYMKYYKIPEIDCAQRMEIDVDTLDSFLSKLN